MELIWHGTASIEVICKQGRILFDPFVPLKHSNVDVKIEDFDGFDHIFVTHGHIDHILSLPDIVKRNPEVLIHCTQTPYKTLLFKGVPAGNLKLIHYDEEVKVDGFRVKAFHGKHAILPKIDFKLAFKWLRSPARRNVSFIDKEFKICQENDETIFYQIKADRKTVALMGSMNLRDEVEYPTGAHVLVLPYNGWADNLPPAINVIERLQPKRILIDHYDQTFPPISPEIDLTPIIDMYQEMITPMSYNTVEKV